MYCSFKTVVSMVIGLTMALAPRGSADPTTIFTAFSLKVARHLVELAPPSGRFVERQQRELRTLGGINRPLAVVFDRKSGDVILVGEHDPVLPELLLDDFDQALKTAILYGLTAPGVSIDPHPGEPDGDAQDVVFFGGIENTHYGQVTFDSDYLWKQLALEAMKSRIAGQDTYLQFAIEEAHREDSRQWRVLSRFWFYPTVVKVEVCEDAAILKDLRVDVLTETLSAEIDNQKVATPREYEDVPAKRFSETFRAKPFAEEFPVFGQLESLARLTALAKGASKILQPGDLDYWIRTYRQEPVNTPTTAKTLRVPYRDDTVELQLSGGVRIVTLVSRLKQRPNLPLVEEVLSARPSEDCLAWTFAIGWSRPHSDPAEERLVEHLKQALYLTELHQYPEALSEVDAALQLDPHLAEAWQLKGLIYREEGQLAASVACLERSVRACPDYADAHAELAVSLTLLDRPDEGIQHFTKALSIAADLHHCHLGLAYAWHAKGDPAEAIRCVRRFLEAVPEGHDSDQARKLLAQLRSRQTENRTAAEEVVTYRNEEHGFSFTHPTSWEVASTDMASAVLEGIPWRPLAVVANPLNLDENVMVAVVEGSGGGTSWPGRSVVDEFVETLGSGQRPGIRMVGTRALSIAGTRGMQYLLRMTTPNPECKVRIVVIHRDDRAYVIVCVAPSEDFADADRRCFEGVISSFRFENQN